MRISIGLSEVCGGIAAPSSKSYTIRGLMCAALANGESELLNPLSSDDTETAITALGKIGVTTECRKDKWLISGGQLHAAKTALYCRESAATLRFLTAVAGSVPGRIRLTASKGLVRRPIQPLVDALQQIGIDCSLDQTTATVTVKGGNFHGGTVRIPGNISSQFVSALMLIGPLAENGITICLTTPLESKPYIEMTIECLKEFGVEAKVSMDFCQITVPKQEYNPTRYVIEGDWSSASYLLALGALRGEVVVENLNPLSLQGDKALLDFLHQMGANIDIDGDAITVRKSKLKGIKADLSDCIDLLPTMAILSAMAEGETELTGVARARLKESNRVSSIKEELNKAGIMVYEEPNYIRIEGSRPMGGRFDSHGDHRIAMALSMIGAVAGNTIIDGAECVSKTYPTFWQELTRIGVKIDVYGE